MSEGSTTLRVAALVSVVRRGFLLRHTVRYALGLAVGFAALSVGAVALAPGWPRWPWLATLGLSFVAGLLYARRRVPDESALVWYVDKRLGAGELVLTFHDATSRGEPVDAGLAREAAARLAAFGPKDVRPRRAGRELWALPFLMALALVAAFFPTPKAAQRARGSEVVRIVDPHELTAVERLPALRAHDDAAREQAAREARALREALERGMTLREAVERVDRLREQVAALRAADSPRSQRAREAAIEALSEEREMASALASRDLEALSRAVERAAARREAADRARAREALSRAAEAARREGDEELAESLLSRERLMEARSEQAALARELADAMPELSGARMRRALETLERDGDAGGLDRQMVEAMRDAWQRLSPEERQRLAEAMSRAAAARSRAEGRDPAQGSGEQPGEQGPQSADDIERQLRAALENLDSLEMRVGGEGGIPVPRPGGGGAPQQAQGRGGQNGPQGGSAPGAEPGGESGTGQSPGQSGPSRGGGPGGTPNGSTRALEGDPLLARVRPLERRGAPAQTFVDWVTPDAEPGSAGTQSPASSGAAGDPNAVTRARVPEEYREHVRAYFGGGD